MRVLIGIPCLLTGGTEVQTLSLVQALVSAGHQPIVACYFESNPSMVIRYENEGAKVVLFSQTNVRPQGVKKKSKFLWENFKKVIRVFNPDVAHIQYMAPGALPILILRALGIKKIIATTHTDANIYGKNGLRIIKFLTNHILSGFQTITLQAEQNYFGSSSLFDGRLKKHFTIYNSLPSHIKIREDHKQFGETLTIGVVSRLVHIKGMDLVFPVISKLLYKMNNTKDVLYPNLRILIVGDGSLKSQMETQAKELPQLNDGKIDVEFIGRKSQNELQGIYDKIDILLMPSRSEGFGLTAIEGMARGCVPIVSNTGGLPEVVTPDSGLLHTSEDIDDMADKILQLIQNPNKLKKLSKGTVERAHIFSFENYASAINSWYSSL